MPDAEFRLFFDEAEPRLRRALVAAYGPERGREAAAEAWAYAWEHWPTVRTMRNPLGYLYRTGQSRTKPRRTRVLVDRSGPLELWTEPDYPPRSGGSRSVSVSPSCSCTASVGRFEKLLTSPASR